MEKENKISVVINTYNAEKFLRRVLDAVKGFDEILICDMESSDHTLEIAKEYGCRIVSFPKKDYVSAEPARDFAIHQAAGPWILVVDADEIVTPELKDFLYAAIRRDDCPQGYYIPRRNRVMNRLCKGRVRDHQLRFFIQKGTSWPPYVHTFPSVEGRVERVPKTAKNVCFIHLDENYVSQQLSKVNRYTDGEVDKKMGRRYGLWALLWRPAWRFFKDFVLNQKYKDGLPGFIASAITGFYQFVLVSKVIERRYRDHER